jgi:hypothetical protein
MMTMIPNRFGRFRGNDSRFRFRPPFLGAEKRNENQPNPDSKRSWESGWWLRGTPRPARSLGAPA